MLRVGFRQSSVFALGRMIDGDLPGLGSQFLCLGFAPAFTTVGTVYLFAPCLAVGHLRTLKHRDELNELITT